MGSIDAGFKTSIFRKDRAVIIATNRASAVLNPIRLRYQSGGYKAGTVLGRNTTDGFYQAYDDGGSSGINTAACILHEERAAEDFSGTAATDSTIAVGIFGGCTVFKDNLTGYDAAALVDLKGTIIIDASGKDTIKF